MSEEPVTEFEKAASQHGSANVFTDFFVFLKHNKKWWLLPVLLLILLFGLLMSASGTALAPFIYTLF